MDTMRTTVEAGGGSKWDFTTTLRFMMGHCYIGPFSVPWHEEEDWVECPFCGEVFTHQHLVWECCGVTDEREAWLREVLPGRVGDLTELVRHGAFRLGRFLQSVRRLLDSREETGE